MPLKVHLKSGPLKGHTFDFDDDAERIAFGRDAERCEVVFPASDTAVAKEHCALRRVLGRYRLVVNGVDPVHIDGRPGQEDEVLEPLAELQLGDGGPLLLVETVLDRRQAAAARERSPESPRTIRQRLRRSMRINRVLLLVAVAVVTGALIWAIRRGKGELRDVEKKLESTRVTFSELSQRDHEKIAHELRRLREADPIRRFRGLIARVEPSIYLVMVRVKKDVYSGVGTAWVVGKNRLATNAHVAEIFEQLKPGYEFLVRSASEKPRDIPVVRVVSHPGYHRFRQAVQNHQPLDPGGASEASFITACDVAILEVADGSVLGPPLPIANHAALHRLEAGEGVAFVGYPLEGVRLSDISRPQPTSQIGHITSLTDVFNGKTIPARRLLIRHNLPVTGGVSGSPLIDREGRVVGVVNAGSFHIIQDPLTGLPRRIPTAIGINFAQRSDLLAELLAGKADAVQARRDKEWQLELARFRSGRKSRTEILAALERYFTMHVRARGVTPKRVERVLEKRGRIEKPGLKHGAAFEIGIPAAGYYLITAVADDVKDLDMAVIVGGRVVGKDEMRDHFPSVIAQFAKDARLKVLLHEKATKLPEVDFTLVVMRAVP